MTAYPDASVIVAAFSHEPASEAAVVWLESLIAGDLITSKWCETEVTSAMAIKTRTGELAVENLGAVLDAVGDLLAASAVNWAIDGSSFDEARDFIRRSDKPLRGGDALHLAIARSSGATLITLDRKMAAAGQALELDVRLLG